MGKLMERAAVRGGKSVETERISANWTRGLDPRQGIIKSAPPPKTKPD